MTTKPAQCLPADDPIIQAIQPEETLKPGEGVCPAEFVCLTPGAMVKLSSSLEELSEWYKETSINCGEKDNDQETHTSDSTSDGDNGSEPGDGSD